MTENLPAPVDGPGREGQIVLYLPTVSRMKEAISEPGPVRGHFRTTLVMMGMAFLLLLFLAFPGLFTALIGLALAGGGYAVIHYMIYSLFFSERDEDDGGY